MTIVVPALRSATSPASWTKNELWRKAATTPSLDLRFAETKSLVDATTGSSLVTFTRASSGTYVGSDGLIKTAGVNVPRFDHDPTTGESLGLLVEEQRVNLLQRTEEFDQSPWSVSSVTVVPNTSAAPDGAQTADTLDWSSGTAVASQAITKAASPVTYTASLFVKSAVTSFSLTVDDGGTVNRGRVVFNLSTGAKITEVNDGSGFSGTTGGVISYPNGWLRITLTTTTNSTTTARFRVFWSDSDVVTWGAQLEPGAFPTSYIPTTSSTVTRAADVASISGSNFSGWYRQDEGTVFARSTFIGDNGLNQFLYSISDGAIGDEIRLFKTPGTTSCTYGVESSASGTTYNVFSDNLSAFGAEFRSAFAFATNNVNRAVSGSLGTTDTSASLPVVNQINIGARMNATFLANARIKRLTYWAQRLPDATLQTITQ